MIEAKVCWRVSDPECRLDRNTYRVQLLLQVDGSPIDLSDMDGKRVRIVVENEPAEGGKTPPGSVFLPRDDITEAAPEHKEETWHDRKSLL